MTISSSDFKLSWVCVIYDPGIQLSNLFCPFFFPLPSPPIHTGDYRLSVPIFESCDILTDLEKILNGPSKNWNQAKDLLWKYVEIASLMELFDF